jgi:hypothetical protein
MPIQTVLTGASVTAFLDSVEDETRRKDGHQLRALMEKVTGAPAEMWGPAIVGFGVKEYFGETVSGLMPIVAFAPRKAATTIYGVFDSDWPSNPLLDRLGLHSTSRWCLYLKRLDDVDLVVLERLVKEAWQRPN